MMEETPNNETRTEQVSEILQQSASQNKEAEEAAAAQIRLMKLSEKLFEYAMNDQWEKVMDEYKKKTECRMAKITGAEDTALHLAVSGGKLEVVYRMVEALGSEEAYVSKVLKAKNNRGNTPLHTAAALGNAHMCHCMASKDPTLIAERNIKNETPFFYAAQFGHKDALLCLYFVYPEKNRADLCSSRDESGDTILHAAISGEHFDLAFQIICKYPKLVDAVNIDGLSPLHVLATKTNAFKSGSRLGLFDRILYSCIPVDELKDKKYDSKNYLKRFEDNGNHDRRHSFPQNYETCVQFFRMIFGVVFYGMPNFVEICSYINHKSISDEENPKRISETSEDEHSSSERKTKSNTSNTALSGTNPNAKGEREKYREHHLPANYATFKQFFKFLIKFLMVILGLGFQGIKKITTKKQRHTWASQVMNKLIESASSMYKYSGGNIGGGNIGEMTEDDFPRSPSLMMNLSHQDTNKGNISKQYSGGKTGNGHGDFSCNPSHHDTKTGNEKDSIEPLNKNGECQIVTDLSKKGGNDAMMEKYLGEYQITGNVDSKSLKHAVQMRFEKKVASESTKSETPTPVLIAASKGITEIVEKILKKFPVAIQDVDAENKNVLLLAVENRQTHTFQFLIERKILHESVFRHWDNQGNNALHLAATYGHSRPWLIPGSALQMQWEIKWYKFVKKSLAKYLLVRYNKKCQTPKHIFTETHKALVKDGSEWLTKTSESCSFIAALIATVAFATAANIPGGVKQETGQPVLRNEPAFSVFAISSLVALCFSITALVFFLAILTSRFEEKDFAKSLPRKLILGLTSLFTSIAAMLLSFCAGHFFELKDKLKFAAFPIYTVACLPISFFALAQLPLYFDLIRAIFKKVPQRSYKEFGS